MDQLSSLQARRIALAAQGFLDRAARRRPTMRTFERTLARTGVLQVDSVNVLQRAHYMPLFSRMGPYDVDLLRRASPSGAPRRMVEYWAHVQAFMPVELWPVMQHRMDHYRAERGKWGFTRRRRPRAARAGRGPRPRAGRPPATSTRSSARPAHQGALGLELVGGAQGPRLPLPRRRPRRSPGAPASSRCSTTCPSGCCPPRCSPRRRRRRGGGHRELVRRAARSHGVGTGAAWPTTTGCPPARAGQPSAKVAIDELVEAGELMPVAVEGWKRPAYLHRDARLPRRVGARALLSPFDPVVWERARTEALFDFHYRIEIYVPADKRVHGYYVLPFLLGDRIVGRVDLKADRAAGAPARAGRVRRAGRPRRRRPRSWPPSCAGWPAGSAWTTSWSSRRGDLAPTRRRSRRWAAWWHDRGYRRTQSPPGVITVPAILDKLLRIGEGKILRQLEADRQGGQRHRGRLRRDERRRAPRA